MDVFHSEVSDEEFDGCDRFTPAWIIEGCCSE